jgi:amino acid transporter
MQPKHMFYAAYFVCLYCLLLERTDFLPYFLLITFFFTYKIIQTEKNNFNFLILISVLFRLLIFSLPNLSQDFYRFIWDGRLILLGLNPFTS